MSKKNQSGVALIGCGLHAKRIYANYLLSRLIQPILIIDMVSNREDVERLVSKNNWHSTLTYYVNPGHSYESFSTAEQEEMCGLMKRLGVKNAIIATPPEVHAPYAKLCLQLGIKVLVDKPLSAPKNVSSGNSEELLDDLRELLHHAHDDTVVVQCQRRRHDGYNYIKNLITEIDNQYGIKPHFIDIYHSDGRWDFPDEIASLTNHPYVTGYGKLLHSGYHFVDLLAFLTSGIPYDGFDLFSYRNGINDFKHQVHDDFYRSTFGINNEHIFSDEGNGEIDSYSLIQLKQNSRVLTTASVNLLHTGFSRRSWGKAKKDLYKGNGRLRHERVNIQIGPLMNIQVHSYQSTEINDTQAIAREDFGGLEHFDIHIFRNTELIGGLPYERVTLQSLEADMGRKPIDAHLGQNEHARYQLVDDFLNGTPSNSCIKSHIRTNILMASIAKSMHEKRQVSRDFCL